MREGDVRERAYAMPLTSPAYPPGPYRFISREYEVLSGVHIIADLTLGLGKVVHDYLR